MADTIQRRIYFFRIKVMPDPNGNAQTFSPAQACTLIGRLRFLEHTEANSRYLSGDRPAEVVCVWPKTHAGKVRLSIGTSRRGALPNLEEMGDVSALAAAAEKGVLEQTHVTFFDDGLVGAEFNFYGPRLSKFAAYCSAKCPALPNVQFLPLVNRDVQKKLQDLRDVHLLQLGLYKSDLELLGRASSHLPAALLATSEQYSCPCRRAMPSACSKVSKTTWGAGA